MTRRLWIMAAFIAVFIAGYGTVRAEPYKVDMGPFSNEIVYGVWVDAARKDRQVPYKIYVPSSAEGARPTIVFSHGLGGTREGNAFLATHLASHGYVAVHIQHPGSDATIWKGRPLDTETAHNAANNIKNAVDRFRDIGFVVDQLSLVNETEDRLSGRIDMLRLGISGHSYGAITTLVTAGQKLGRREMSFADSRFKAALAYSPAPPRGAGERFGQNLSRIYDAMIMPVFHMTGTEDGSPISDMEPAERRIPFETIKGVDQYLLVLDGGDHMVFSGRRFLGPAKASDDRHHDLIRMASLAYWDAYLLENAEAYHWLESGGLKDALDSTDELVIKHAGDVCKLGAAPDVCEAF